MLQATDSFRSPSAGDSSHNSILTTITQGIDSGPQASFEASLSDFDVGALFLNVRPAREIDLKQLSEGK